WDLDICGIQSVKDIKQKCPNVKLVFSIGGRGTKYPFSPIEKNYWCDNAVDSLKTIIKQYNDIFAGIDINYEHINTNDENDFSNYVGDVINRLKNEVGIDVVSIAPSHANDNYYKLLYSAHADDINWVDYQFYMQPIPTENEFLSLFLSLAREYALEKLLVGASTDPRDGGNVPLDVFVQTCTNLIKHKSLSGIFIWNANDYEKIALDILTNN
ncbi:glycoside hydrolase family 18 protein, partial [Medicago truncatula]